LQDPGARSCSVRRNHSQHFAVFGVGEHVECAVGPGADTAQALAEFGEQYLLIDDPAVVQIDPARMARGQRRDDQVAAPGPCVSTSLPTAPDRFYL